jgi:hypothetical protein
MVQASLTEQVGSRMLDRATCLKLLVPNKMAQASRTDQVGSSGNDSDFYYGGDRLESWPRHRQSERYRGFC